MTGAGSGIGEGIAIVFRRTPIGRTAEPREIAEVAVFLASDASGTTVYVDGGRLALNGVVPVGEAPNRANAALSCRTAAGARPPRVIRPCRLRSDAGEW